MVTKQNFKNIMKKTIICSLSTLSVLSLSNCTKGPGTNYSVERQIDKGVAITIIEEKKLSNGSTWCKAKSGYWVNKKYLEFVKYV